MLDISGEGHPATEANESAECLPTKQGTDCGRASLADSTKYNTGKGNVGGLVLYELMDEGNRLLQTFNL